jgi:hypothetical protein
LIISLVDSQQPVRISVLATCCFLVRLREVFRFHEALSTLPADVLRTHSSSVVQTAQFSNRWTLRQLNFSGCLLEGIDASDAGGTRAAICAGDNQLISYQWISMKVILISILANVVTPPHLSAGLVESVENSGAGTNEQEIARNCGPAMDSTTSFKLPQLPACNFIGVSRGTLKRPLSLHASCRREPERKDQDQ